MWLFFLQISHHKICLSLPLLQNQAQGFPSLISGLRNGQVQSEEPFSPRKIKTYSGWKYFLSSSFGDLFHFLKSPLDIFQSPTVCSGQHHTWTNPKCWCLIWRLNCCREVAKKNSLFMVRHKQMWICWPHFLHLILKKISPHCERS